MTEVFDIGWSSDGTVVAAGLQRSILLLDMSKILQKPLESLIPISDPRPHVTEVPRNTHDEIYKAQ